MTVFFFGTNFTAVKIVVESVPPILFAATRFTLAGLLLLLFVPFLEPGSRLRREDFLPVLGLGVVGVTLTQTVFTIGVSLTTAANTALVYSTAPVWGMLLGFALGLERPRLAGILGIGLSLLGVGFIVYGGLEFAGTSLVGDALILVAAVFWGSYTVLSLSLLERYSPVALAAYAMTLGGLAAFPLAALDPGGLDIRSLDGLDVGSGGLLGALLLGLRLRRLGIWSLPRRGQPGPDLPVPRHPDGRDYGHRTPRRRLRTRPTPRRSRHPLRRLPGEKEIVEGRRTFRFSP